MSDQLEGRNPVVEVLRRNRRRVHRVWIDQGAGKDERIDEIVRLATERGVRIDRVPRQHLDGLCHGRVHNGVVAAADPLPGYTGAQLVDKVMNAGEDPFLLAADGLSYEHNLGAILRSSLGFGVHGMLIPTHRGADIGPVVQRVSMGAFEEVPIVREGLFSALKSVSKAGIPIVGADMGGTPLHKARLAGPLCLVLGEEGRGLSSKLRERCDQIVSVPLAGGLESLNVSVAAAVLMYEKRRQDGWFSA